MRISSTKPISLLRIEYAEAAQAYLAMLRTEHFMESTKQARQRTITLESFDIVCARRKDIHAFNELLIQYKLKKHGPIQRVVPDNMVVLWADEIKAEGSYDLELQPIGPHLALEYVSKDNKRKDYEESFQKYETHIKVPYLLLFYPDNQELTLYRHNKRKYVSVKENDAGRLPIPDLEIEVALLDGWVRLWFRGELVPLPPELQAELDELRRINDELKGENSELKDQNSELLGQNDGLKEQNDDLTHRLSDEKRRAEAAEQQVAHLLAEIERVSARKANGSRK